MDTNSASDDLAYLRALVDAPGNFQRSFGEAYFAAGLCYGLQMLGHAAQLVGWLPGDGLPALLLGLGPSVVFVALLTWIILRERASGRPTGGAIAKAVAAVLGAIGIANLVMICVFGVVAWRENSLTIWLIYPCSVMALQGTAWMVIFALRRRTWFGLVAAGWFATAIAMAASLAFQLMPAFVAAAGFGFLAFMLIPGWVMMRNSRIG